MKKLLTSIVLIVAFLFSAPCFAGLDPVEEARHAELKKMCAELKVPAPPEIFIRFQVHDKDGKLVFDDRQRGHSWTRNFYNTLLAFIAQYGGTATDNFGAGYVTAKQTGGAVSYTERAVYLGDYEILNHGITEAAATGNFGVKVGTSDTAFSPEQYALGAAITNGVGAGQLAHIAMGKTLANYDNTPGAEKWIATSIRVFNNNSGSLITIKETALYWHGTVFQGALLNWMWERSVLSPAVDVPNGAQLTVTYEISMDFSAID
jgi:hypothetical protein